MANSQNNYQNIREYSYYISLISRILAIQALSINKSQSKNQDLTDKILTISVFMSACSNFIDLSIAKKVYDETKNKKQHKSAKDILIGSFLSTIASLYFLKVVLQSNDDELLFD